MADDLYDTHDRSRSVAKGVRAPERIEFARVGIEVGGTFTDLVAVGPCGIRIAKVPSVPKSPDIGAINALEAAFPPKQIARIDEIVHGSTVATNAVLERNGARLAFVTTKGFRDLLLLQRHDRLSMFDLFYRKPVPVVSRSDTIEIEERILADGTIAIPLDQAATETALCDFLDTDRFEAIAICLLNAYANSDHEHRLRDMIRRHYPNIPITCSCDIDREFREYERASTTTLAAYVQPRVNDYLQRFEQALAKRGFAGQLSMMQSSGGRAPVEAIRDNAITTLFSGPAAGVVGAVSQAAILGFGDVISLDMGGTSTDVCLISSGRPERVSETVIHGLPVRTPIVDIVTVGAGGSSIIWIDDGGMLHVGPSSAGADPGPACYGRGGTSPTLTDAQLVRGAIPAGTRLAGQLTLDVEAAKQALEPLAKRFAMSVEQLSDSAVMLANANVVSAIKSISTERGHDPRDYRLVAYGGAGGLHAAQVAEELRIDTVIVPPHAGVLSAYGLLASDHTMIESVTRRTLLDESAPETVREVFAGLRDSLLDRIAGLAVGGDVAFEFSVDMRFVGQAFHIAVELDADNVESIELEHLFQAFREAHHKIYRHGGMSTTDAEIVAFRVAANVRRGDAPMLDGSGRSKAPGTKSRLLDKGEQYDAAIIERSEITHDRTIGGCAIIIDSTSAIYVSPGWQATLGAGGNLILREDTRNGS